MTVRLCFLKKLNYVPMLFAQYYPCPIKFGSTWLFNKIWQRRRGSKDVWISEVSQKPASQGACPNGALEKIPVKCTAHLFGIRVSLQMCSLEGQTLKENGCFRVHCCKTRAFVCALARLSLFCCVPKQCAIAKLLHVDQVRGNVKETTEQTRGQL